MQIKAFTVRVGWSGPKVNSLTLIQAFALEGNYLPQASTSPWKMAASSKGSGCSEWVSLCRLLSPVIDRGQIVLPDVPVPVFLLKAL
jgi:hypothetical protein